MRHQVGGGYSSERNGWVDASEFIDKYRLRIVTVGLDIALKYHTNISVKKPCQIAKV
jgi:hypothetical protein